MKTSKNLKQLSRRNYRGSARKIVTWTFTLVLAAASYFLFTNGTLTQWMNYLDSKPSDKKTDYKSPPLFSPPLPSGREVIVTGRDSSTNASGATENNINAHKSIADQIASMAMLRLPQPKPQPKLPPRIAKPLQFEKRTLNHVSFYQTTIDLSDPETFIEIGLANKSKIANTQTVTFGDENFASMLKRYPAAVVVNGTFFAKSDYKCVMGNMVSGGQRLKYSQWETYGTTLGLKAGNVPEMVTACDTGQPDWDSHWFSLTCGPRLLKDGQVWLYPEAEKFEDPHVLGIGPRSAIGYGARKDKLYLITFLNGLSLEGEAKMMKAIGCSDAMNLDGGASKALAHNGAVLVTPGRNLTNIIAVYDVRNRAPKELVDSWKQFQLTHARATQL